MRPGPVLGEKPPGLVPVRDGTKFVCPRREAKPQDILCPQRRFLYRRTQEAPQGPLQFPIRGPAGQAFFPNSNITLPMDAELEMRPLFLGPVWGFFVVYITVSEQELIQFTGVQLSGHRQRQALQFRKHFFCLLTDFLHIRLRFLSRQTP